MKTMTSGVVVLAFALLGCGLEDASDEDMEFDSIRQEAASSLGTYYYISSDRSVRNSDGLVTLVSLPSFSLAPGQSVFMMGNGLTTHHFAGSDATKKYPHLSQEMNVKCTSSTDTTLRTLAATRNHRGSIDGQLRVSIKYLLRNNTTSTHTYSCSLNASTGHALDSSSYLRYLASGTWIRRGTTHADVAVWGTRDQTNSVEFSGTRYDLDQRVSATTASSEVWVQAVLTSCWNGFSAPCTGGTATESVADARLMVQQMASSTSSTVCAVTYDPPSGYERTTISGLTHHAPLFNEKIAVGLSSNCGTSTSFIPKMEYKRVSGNNLMIHKGNGRTGHSQAWMGPY